MLLKIKECHEVIPRSNFLQIVNEFNLIEPLQILIFFEKNQNVIDRIDVQKHE